MLEQCSKILDGALAEVSKHDISICARLLSENLNNLQRDSYSMNLPTDFTNTGSVDGELEQLVANNLLLCACSLSIVSADRALLDSIILNKNSWR